MSLQQTIEDKLRAVLSPSHLEVVNESHMHNVAPGAESHFRLFVVSSEFEGKSLVQRHQAVYKALAEEMAHHIHALGMQTLTPVEWNADQVDRIESPECLGGAKG